MIWNYKKCPGGKYVYLKNTALQVKNRRMREGEKNLRAYNCPDCKGWHLTSTMDTKAYKASRRYSESRAFRRLKSIKEKKWNKYELE